MNKTVNPCAVFCSKTVDVSAAHCHTQINTLQKFVIECSIKLVLPCQYDSVKIDYRVVTNKSMINFSLSVCQILVKSLSYKDDPTCQYEEFLLVIMTSSILSQWQCQNKQACTSTTYNTIMSTLGWVYVGTILKDKSFVTLSLLYILQCHWCRRLGHKPIKIDD